MTIRFGRPRISEPHAGVFQWVPRRESEGKNKRINFGDGADHACGHGAHVAQGARGDTGGREVERRQHEGHGSERPRRERPYSDVSIVALPTGKRAMLFSCGIATVARISMASAPIADPKGTADGSSASFVASDGEAWPVVGRCRATCC